MISSLYTSDGRPLQLGKRIGKGGEGEVFILPESPNLAAKIYTVADLASREAKVRAMLAAKLMSTTSLIAYPSGLIVDRTGKFVGFMMRLIPNHQSLHELYGVAARKTAFPKADYRFLVRTATNIARAIAQAHSDNCVIGDINHSSILVSQQATVALIDSDSFQFTVGATQHRCRVGVQEYTPPELQGKHLDVVRTPNQDAFGLAVVSFQLLFMGRHPFAGRPKRADIPLERAIQEFRFAYSRVRDVGLEPPPAVPTLDQFPAFIAAAFEQAFGPTGPRNRPSAKQWISLLEELEQNLKDCTSNPRHHYPHSATECLWCRMERLQGVQLFLPPHIAQHASLRNNAGEYVAWQQIWQAIEAIKLPAPARSTPVLPALNPAPSAKARAIGSGYAPHKIVGLLIIVASVGLLLALPSAALFALIGFAYGAYQAFRADPRREAFTREADQLEERWANALGQWQVRASDGDFARMLASLQGIKRQIEELATEEQAKIQQYERNRRGHQLSQYLDRFQIRHANITHIGPSRRALLASYGIETAADVTPTALFRVPGFGPVTSRPLLDWRRGLEGAFRFNAAHMGADVAAVAAIKAEMANKARALVARLAQGPAQLASVVGAVEAARRTATPELQSLHQEREQMAADLKFLGLPAPRARTARAPASFYPPPSQRPPQASSPIPPSSVSRTHGGRSCPRCGGSMVLRTAKRGRSPGRRFYGCSNYPACRGTRPSP